jgi:hypothetical protein
MKKLFIIGIIYLSSVCAKAQGINFNMESWHNVPVTVNPTLGLELPNQWYSTDSVGSILKMMYPNANIVKQTFRTTDAHSGQYAAKITTFNQDVLGVSSTFFTNTQPDIDMSKMVKGAILADALVYKGGTKISERIPNISAWVKYLPATGDRGLIWVEVVAAGKGVNGTDSVLGFGERILDSTYSVYTKFTVPVLYDDLKTEPTHVKIYFGSSYDNPQEGSIMYIDDVNIPVTKTAVEALTLKQNVMAYPNPAKDNITFITVDHEDKLLTIYNTTGSSITTINMNGSYQYDCSKLPDGLYVYTVQDNDGANTQKGMFVIAK